MGKMKMEKTVERHRHPVAAGELWLSSLPSLPNRQSCDGEARPVREEHCGVLGNGAPPWRRCIASVGCFPP